MDQWAKSVIEAMDYKHDFNTPFLPAQKVALKIQNDHFG